MYSLKGLNGNFNEHERENKHNIKIYFSLLARERTSRRKWFHLEKHFNDSYRLLRERFPREEKELKFIWTLLTLSERLYREIRFK